MCFLRTGNEFKLLDQLDFKRFITRGPVTLDVCFPALINAIFVINLWLGQKKLHWWTRLRMADSGGTRMLGFEAPQGPTSHSNKLRSQVTQ